MGNKVIIVVLLCLLALNADGNDNVAPSGTLPILYVNTDSCQAIVDKDVYVDGSYYLDALDLDGFESIGSQENPLRLKIKGRGNWTWITFDKKPYRIKLETKQSLLGMSESRHFVLLAHVEDRFGYVRESTAFELSRRIGLSYTPAEQPIEVVLNGDYIGIYFLTEQIRVASNRVNIIEQDDDETDPEKVTGGWLLELDGHDDENLIVLGSRDGYWFPLVSHSPEKLSDEQYNYLVNYINLIDSLIYDSGVDNCEWANYLDIDSLACYYLVNEVMDNIEAFSGSCYMHKNRGDESKLIFGPVWDFGNAFNRSELTFIYDNSQYMCHWLNGVIRFPKFKECVRRHWEDFYNDGLQDIDQFIDNYAGRIQAACVSNCERWPQYGYTDVWERKEQFKNKLHAKIDFLNDQFAGLNESLERCEIDEIQYVDLLGRISQRPFKGLNIVITIYRDGHTSTVKKIL